MPAGVPTLCNCSYGKPLEISQSFVVVMLFRSFLAELKYKKKKRGVCMYVSVCIHIYACVCIEVYTCIFVCTHMHICMLVYMDTQT